MIELTKDEALAILKELSLLEGYLFSVQNSGDVIESMDYSIDLLTEKLKQD